MYLNMLLKIGSKGENVKQLLKWLGLTADGSFGNKTAQAVKAFQSKNKLTADGIVGDKTWNLLKSLHLITVTETSKNTNNANKTEKSENIDINIILLPIPLCTTKKLNRTIKYLVIHYTGSSNSKSPRAKNNKNVFLLGLAKKQYASADFAVDDTDIVLFNPDLKNYYCWAVGGKSYGNNGGKLYGIATNSNCISIEICSTCTPSTSAALSVPNHSGWSFTEETLNNAIKLTKYLMKQYNIDIDHVIRHYDVTGKFCPGIIGWNNEPIYNINGKKTEKNSDSSEWIKFKERLK